MLKETPTLGNFEGQIAQAIKSKNAETLFGVLKIASREVIGRDIYEGDAEDFLRDEVKKFLEDETRASMIFSLGDDENSMTIYREGKEISFQWNEEASEEVKTKWEGLK